MNKFTLEHLEQCLAGMQKWYVRGEKAMFYGYADNFYLLYNKSKEMYQTEQDKEYLKDAKKRYSNLLELGIAKFKDIEQKLKEKRLEEKIEPPM